MDYEIKESLDLRGVVCPHNFNAAYEKLKSFEQGECLEILLDEGDSITNVPRSLKESGQLVVKVCPLDAGSAFSVVVRKSGEGRDDIECGA